MSEENSDWIHISEIARTYNITQSVVSGWWKDAPKDDRKRMANLKLLKKEFVEFQVMRAKVTLLIRALDIPGPPYLKVTDSAEEEAKLHEVLALVKDYFPEYYEQRMKDEF